MGTRTGLVIGIVAVVVGWSAMARAQAAPVKLEAPHFQEEVVFFGLGPRGELRPPELDLLGTLLRCRRTGRQMPVHPRLARTLVTMARRFGRPIRVISGYRAVQVNNHPHSYHMRGMAADISIPGVSVADLRDYAVERRIGGVGYYPNSGFLHVDVRPRRFWWVDYSRPGQREQLLPDPDGTAPEHRATDRVQVSARE